MHRGPTLLLRIKSMMIKSMMKTHEYLIVGISADHMILYAHDM